MFSINGLILQADLVSDPEKLQTIWDYLPVVVIIIVFSALMYLFKKYEKYRDKMDAHFLDTQQTSVKRQVENTNALELATKTLSNLNDKIDVSVKELKETIVTNHSDIIDKLKS